MKKIVNTLILSLTLIPAMAQQRDMEELEQIARGAYVQMNKSVIGANARSMSQHMEMVAIPSQDIANIGRIGGEKDAFYVFKSAKSGEAGFVIVSTDLAQRPILAYSSEGYFDQDNIPENVAHWLSSYVVESEQLRRGEILTADYTGYSGSVSPLVTARWNQDAPYYNMCPIYNGYHCVTGCTATGIAQVMNYHKYPTTPTGSVNYTTEAYHIPVSENLDSYTLDWNNMLDTYSNGNYNTTQSNAVATLMYTVGAALKSDYTPGSTGAITSHILPTLTSNFKYDIDALHCQKALMSHNDWLDMLIGELKANRPIIYTGDTGTGGHCFVVDGYQVSDDAPLFHVNWGWGGSYDGYFYISNLNPRGSGIGGSTGAYQYINTAVINLHSENGVQDDITSRFGISKITPTPENIGLNDSKQIILSLTDFINLQQRTFDGYLNIYIVDENGVETFLRSIQCNALTFWSALNANISVNLPEDIQPGLYKLRAKTKDYMSNREQIVVMPEEATIMVDNFENDTYTWFTYNITGGNTITVTGTNSKFNQTELVIPETVTYRNKEYTVTAIGNNAFRNYSSPITSISIPHTVRTIGQAAFAGCQHVTSLDIPEGVESIGADCFNDMTNLRTLNLPTTLSSLPGSADMYTTHMGTMVALESITISPGDAHYRSVDGVLYSKGMEILIKYPANKSGAVFKIPMGVQMVLNHAFRSCRQLQDVVIPPSVNHIGGYAFDNDYYITPSLRNVYLSSVVPSEGSVTAFAGAGRLTLHVPESALASFSGHSPWTSFSAIEGYKQGNTNNDEAINILDVLATLSIMKGDVCTFNQSAADANEDGNVNILDVLKILEIMKNQ